MQCLTRRQRSSRLSFVIHVVATACCCVWLLGMTNPHAQWTPNSRRGFNNRPKTLRESISAMKSPLLRSSKILSTGASAVKACKVHATQIHETYGVTELEYSNTVIIEKRTGKCPKPCPIEKPFRNMDNNGACTSIIPHRYMLTLEVDDGALSLSTFQKKIETTFGEQVIIILSAINNGELIYIRCKSKQALQDLSTWTEVKSITKDQVIVQQQLKSVQERQSTGASFDRVNSERQRRMDADGKYTEKRRCHQVAFSPQIQDLFDTQNDCEIYGPKGWGDQSMIWFIGSGIHRNFHNLFYDANHFNRILVKFDLNYDLRNPYHYRCEMSPESHSYSSCGDPNPDRINDNMPSNDAAIEAAGYEGVAPRAKIGVVKIENDRNWEWGEEWGPSQSTLFDIFQGLGIACSQASWRYSMYRHVVHLHDFFLHDATLENPYEDGTYGNAKRLLNEQLKYCAEQNVLVVIAAGDAHSTEAADVTSATYKSCDLFSDVFLYGHLVVGAHNPDRKIDAQTYLLYATDKNEDPKSKIKTCIDFLAPGVSYYGHRTTFASAYASGFVALVLNHPQFRGLKNLVEVRKGLLSIFTISISRFGLHVLRGMWKHENFITLRLEYLAKRTNFKCEDEACEPPKPEFKDDYGYNYWDGEEKARLLELINNLN